VGWFNGFVLYVLIWWIVLFAVLPFGIEPVSEADEQTGWRGAPSQPGMMRRVLITTLVSALLWFGCYAVITSDWLSFRHGWLALPDR
jgi:predicted secreted protein